LDFGAPDMVKEHRRKVLIGNKKIA
jgi:hypothetical protein